MEKQPEQPEITARDILIRLITDVKNDWNATGVRLWAQYRLKELDKE